MEGKAQMSYDISTWKTKRLENLIIPLSAFYKHERSDWHPSQPTIVKAVTGEISLACGCEQEIKGILSGENIRVTEFNMRGEGSGTFYNWILEPALQESTGILEAIMVWEGGDSINKLTAIDGKVETVPVEL